MFSMPPGLVQKVTFIVPAAPSPAHLLHQVAASSQSISVTNNHGDSPTRVIVCKVSNRCQNDLLSRLGATTQNAQTLVRPVEWKQLSIEKEEEISLKRQLISCVLGLWHICITHIQRKMRSK